MKQILIPTRTAIAAESGPRAGGSIHWPIHVAALAWIGLFLLLAELAPFAYTRAVQEDRFVEWWTVALFAAAAVVRIGQAWPMRRIFDLLIAGFCIFVAGEEMSWGQRLLGFTPPDVFLERNVQQEFTLHNFADVFGKPKGILMLALLGYGLLLPLTSRSSVGRRLLDRIGATPPARDTIPWFLVAVALLFVYPVDYTGEWVEALAGGLFLVAARPHPRTVLTSGVITASFAAILTVVSGRGLSSTPAALTCARAEAEALTRDLSTTAAGRNLLGHRGSLHKRVWTSVGDGYLLPAELRLYPAVSCGQSQRHFIDPWGMAYWVRVSPWKNGTRTLSVYSMGPNRRRDHEDGGSGDDPTGDDIVRTMIIEDR